MSARTDVVSDIVSRAFMDHFIAIDRLKGKLQFEIKIAFCGRCERKRKRKTERRETLRYKYIF